MSISQRGVRRACYWLGAQHHDGSEMLEAPGDDVAEIYIYAVFPLQ